MAKDEFDQMAATSGLINQHLLCNLKSSNLSFETWHCDSYDRGALTGLGSFFIAWRTVNCNFHVIVLSCSWWKATVTSVVFRFTETALQGPFCLLQTCLINQTEISPNITWQLSMLFHTCLNSTDESLYSIMYFKILVKSKCGGDMSLFQNNMISC